MLLRKVNKPNYMNGYFEFILSQHLQMLSENVGRVRFY
jgi:hypothetical protein